MIITSFENEKIKNIIKLKEKKYRDSSNLFLIEGRNLVLEAYRAGIIHTLILVEDEIMPFKVETIYINKDLAKKLSEVENNQSVFAVCHKKEENDNYKDKVIILDKVQDPGNLGTIIRSAVAFNIDTIILGEETVDLYNPKVIRATQGMMFFVNIVRGKIEEAIPKLKNNDLVIYGTSVENGINVKNLKMRDKNKFALIVGNEGKGVSKEILDLCDVNLKISMNKLVDSLNVGVATSILLYELSGDDNVS